MRRLIFPLVLGLGGAAVLVSLGLWQLDRLGQKEAYIAEIDARISAAPVGLPPAPDPASDRFLPVAVAGSYLDGEILVLSGMKGVGAGYRVIAPFQTDAGPRILVDRGFVPEARKGEAHTTGQARIEGNLHWPDESDSYTPEPDRDAGLWFARDVPSMAAALGTEQILLVLARTSQTDTGVTPQPVDTSGIPNDHLEYAVTWFGLALVWLGMTAFLIRRTLRRPD